VSTPLLPVFCTEADLDADVLTPPVVPAGAATVRVLVRRAGTPLGYVDLPAGTPFTREVLVQNLPAPARDGLDRQPADAPLASVATDERVSVVVCTRERAATLVGCLEHLAGLTYPGLEFVVVDNAPRSAATREVVEALAARDPRFRYVLEARPGLSIARNTGLRAATGDVVAFTDDDVRVDPLWVHGLVRGFARRADVACVTGLAAAASLDSPLEAYFDGRVSWAAVRAPRVFDLGAGREDGALYPFAAGVFGTGANFAVRRSVMLELGAFDEALGAGAPTRGGEDLDAFVKVVLEGYALAFEPSAVVWHHHRSDLAALRTQMYGYGTGLTAFYAKLLLTPSTRAGVLRAVPQGVAKLARTVLSTRRAPGGGAGEERQQAPKGLLVRELAGMVAGPALYWRARRAV